MVITADLGVVIFGVHKVTSICLPRKSRNTHFFLLQLNPQWGLPVTDTCYRGFTVVKTAITDTCYCGFIVAKTAIMANISARHPLTCITALFAVIFLRIRPTLLINYPLLSMSYVLIIYYVVFPEGVHMDGAPLCQKAPPEVRGVLLANIGKLSKEMSPRASSGSREPRLFAVWAYSSNEDSADCLDEVLGVPKQPPDQEDVPVKYQKFGKQKNDRK